MDVLRAIGPPTLALFTVLIVDHLTRRRGLLPPAFGIPAAAATQLVVSALLRRGVAMTVLWLVLWIGVFSPLGSVGLEQQIDLSNTSPIELFLLHFLLVLCLMVWYVSGFVPRPAGDRRENFSWTSQLGLRTDSIARELAIGLVAGVGAWLVVIGALLAIALTLWWLGGEELLPKEPPKLIPWIAGLPVLVRLAISLSAGLVEETFFRGFLQPRVGLALSTALFVLAHASYEQPLMLVGVTLLSVIYGGLVYWRQNLWPAITAHALFDAVQLLLVIPAVLRVLPEEGGEVALRVLGLI